MELYKNSFSKTKSVNKSKIKGIGLVNEPEYLSVSKKFHCPNCDAKHYAKIINANQIFQENKNVAIKYGIKYLIMTVIGATIIMIIMNIPAFIAEKIRLNKLEQLNQERYENFKKDYGLK